MLNQCLMPSDIARLTYGYLLETNCTQTARVFLDESPYLREFAQGIKNGFQYSTKPYNMSLIETLNGRFCNQTNQSINSSFATAFSNLYSQETTKDDLTVASESSQTNCDRRHLSTPKNKVLQSRNLNAYSPRRKSATPKRLLNQQPPYRRQQNFQSDPIQQLVNSSPISSIVCESSEIDIEVQPQTIFDELLKYSPLHDKVANTIQKIIDVKDNPNDVPQQTNDNNQPLTHSSIGQTNKNKEPVKNVSNHSEKIGDIEKDLLPTETMDELISSLTEEPEFQNFVHIVVEKEIANTPYKAMLNTPSNASNSSLNTPNFPGASGLTPINNDSKMKNSNMPVKNLMDELKTPEKTTNSSNRMNCNKINNNNNNSNGKIRPILQNHNFVPRFSRVNNKQKEVHEALKQNDCTVNNLNKNPKPLTTTIEVVNETNSNENNQTINETSQDVSVLSIQNWSSSNTSNLIQPVVIPNNQTIDWSGQQLVYLPYPITTATQDTVYYIDSSSINLPTITTANSSLTTMTNATTDPTKAMTATIVNDNISQQQQQSINKPIQSTDNIRIEPTRTIPSILSKGKRLSKTPPTTSIQVSTSSADAVMQPQLEPLQTSNQTQSVNVQALHRRKSENISQKTLISNSQQLSISSQKKRKMSGSSDEVKKRTSVPDSQVEKFLGSNIDEFLQIYHNNNKNQTTNTTK